MKIEMTQHEITELAELLADGYGDYYNDKISAFPIHFFICEQSEHNYYVDGCFAGTPKNAVAYIGELREPPSLPGAELKNNCILDFIEDIENAEWND